MYVCVSVLRLYQAEKCISVVRVRPSEVIRLAGAVFTDNSISNLVCKGFILSTDPVQELGF